MSFVASINKRWILYYYVIIMKLPRGPFFVQALSFCFETTVFKLHDIMLHALNQSIQWPETYGRKTNVHLLFSLIDTTATLYRCCSFFWPLGESPCALTSRFFYIIFIQFLGWCKNLPFLNSLVVFFHHGWKINVITKT